MDVSVLIYACYIVDMLNVLSDGVNPLLMLLMCLSGVCESIVFCGYVGQQWRTQEFCSRGVQQIQLRTERTWICGRWFWRQLLFGTRNFISYSKIFFIFGTLRLFMMTTNLFVIANVKHLRTDGSFRNLLPFSPNILGCWCSKFSNL